MFRTWMITVVMVLLAPGFILGGLDLIRMVFNLARFAHD
jgi:hypothetical protein